MLNDTPSALLPVYATFPLRAASGHGSWLVDEDGQEWLDAYGGHAVATCGHSHPEVVRAIADQAARLLFYSTAVPHAGRERLADALIARAPAPLAKVFFCNSGAEANENLLGLARRKTGRQGVVTLRGGWHGRTVATLACTDGAKYEAGAMRAGMPLSRKVPLNDIAALDAAIDDTIAAVLIEPVQGFNGARTCTTEFLQAGRAAIRDVLEAEEALISARDALTSALVAYRVADLNLQRDMAVLRVSEDGLWQEFDYDDGD